MTLTKFNFFVCPFSAEYLIFETSEMFLVVSIMLVLDFALRFRKMLSLIIIIIISYRWLTNWIRHVLDFTWSIKKILGPNQIKQLYTLYH